MSCCRLQVTAAEQMSCVVRLCWAHTPGCLCCRLLWIPALFAHGAHLPLYVRLSHRFSEGGGGITRPPQSGAPR